ncbi:diguanylate cyclase (GGDEF) domain-containing protein [Eubacterium aggregans]|uniref:Diguanylate cyclase (GGDEF) domain-containing protein n=1 Tax=Eubacterium aggregans TaxID=81409 RepID=A0A1H4ALG2_9FIRM|nr:diguanylate cyclase [Eubacterium aggregans]SEA36514.1 diguanylate cyclase (GGDEF) domain-containing protein [Eubacterium aggregans]
MAFNRFYKNYTAKFISALFILFILATQIVLINRTTTSIETAIKADLSKESYQSLSIVEARLSGRYYMLRSLSDYLRHNPDALDDEDTLKGMMASIRDTGDFTSVGFADASGDALLARSNTANIADRTYFKQSISGKEAIELISNSRISQEPRIIISVPVQSDAIGSIVLFASFSMDAFGQAFNISGQNVDGTAFICTQDLALVTNLSTETHYQLTAMSDITLTEDNQAQLTADMAARVGNTLDCKYNGSSAYLSYVPMTINNWVFFTLIPKEDLATAAFSFQPLLYILLGVITVAATLLVLFFLHREIQTRRELEADRTKLAMKEEQYRLISNLSETILFEADPKTGAFRFNDQFETVFHRSPEATTIDFFSTPQAIVASDDMDAFLNIGRNMKLGTPHYNTSFRLLDHEGTPTWMDFEFITLSDDHNVPQRIIGRMNNIDKEKRELLDLNSKAYKDGLTQAFNRQGFLRMVSDVFEQSSDTQYHALMLLDLDDFKHINDTYGHDRGDIVLQSVAATLMDCLRSSDITGRLGGDEFIALVKDIRSCEDFLPIAEKICTRIAALPSNASGTEQVSCSLGIALYPTDGTHFSQLYKAADIALYEAKHEGKATYVFYDRTLQSS